MPALEVGRVHTFERTFTDEDIRAFGELSGDRGAHHVVAGPGGRLMAQGLLTATMPTKIGGDVDFVAREMWFEFVRPVWSGDTVRCDVTVVGERPGTDRTWFTLEIVCANQVGEEVLRGRCVGFPASAIAG